MACGGVLDACCTDEGTAARHFCPMSSYPAAAERRPEWGIGWIGQAWVLPGLTWRCSSSVPPEKPPNQTEPVNQKEESRKQKKGKKGRQKTTREKKSKEEKSLTIRLRLLIFLVHCSVHCSLHANSSDPPTLLRHLHPSIACVIYWHVYVL